MLQLLYDKPELLLLFEQHGNLLKYLSAFDCRVLTKTEQKVLPEEFPTPTEWYADGPLGTMLHLYVYKLLLCHGTT